MINEFKKGIKMIPYGYRVKTNLAAGLIFMVVGFAIEIFSKGTTFLGGYFIMITPIWFAQMLYTLQLSNEVQASRYKKAFQTWIPSVINLIGALVLFTGIVVMRGIFVSNHPEMAQGVTFGVIWVALMGAFFMLYMALAYKAYWISFIMFFVVYFSTFNMFNDVSSGHVNDYALSFGTTVALGYAVLFAGAILQFAVSCAVYKFPVSPKVMGAFARKKFS